MVESTSEPGGAVRQLVRERALSGVETGGGLVEGAVEAAPPLGLEPYAERRRPTGSDCDQSSIPFRGEDGTAISRDGIRPAR